MWRRVLGAGVMAITLGVVVGAQPADAQEPAGGGGIGLPPGFGEADTDADGEISMEECEALSPEQVTSMNDWVRDQVDARDDGEVRDWADTHIPTGFEVVRCGIGAGIPDQGVAENVGDAVDDVAGIPGDIGGAVLDAPGAVARRGFDAVADSFAEGADTLLVEVTTAWTAIPSTSATQTGVIETLSADLRPLTAVLAVIALIVAMARLAWTARGQAMQEIFSALVRVLFVGAAGIAVLTILLQAGDEFSDYLINRATGGGLSTESLAVFAAGAITSSGLLLLLAVLAIITSVIQIAMLLIRSAMVVVLAGAWQVSAAGGALGDPGMFKRITGWLLAFVLYKPAAAVVYAAGFRLLHADGDGLAAGLLATIQGLLLLILAILVLPAMIRLVAPAAAMSGPSAAGAVAAAAGMATGAVMLAGAGGAASGVIGASSGPSGSLPGGQGQPPASPPPPGPPPADSAPTGGPATGDGGGTGPPPGGPASEPAGGGGAAGGGDAPGGGDTPGAKPGAAPTPRESGAPAGAESGGGADAPRSPTGGGPTGSGVPGTVATVARAVEDGADGAADREDGQ